MLAKPLGIHLATLKAELKDSLRVLQRMVTLKVLSKVGLTALHLTVTAWGRRKVDLLTGRG